ncbi:S49 family peptidase [Methylocystis hirsuta]|uniref:S49 family peptidase n=1 Tax=Methylocystis hirsuta TaxID=369798 RepID=A0A3M9XNP1_9HYPH|nr:S49 family peptidase [Methylocystis hirsuta]RNJ49372.1 S49 family peptidase [Methylocystis hirsuta]
MKYAHLSARLFNTPLLLLPEYGNVLHAALADRLGVEPIVTQDVVDSYRRPTRSMVVDKREGIAVLPIVGGMVHRSAGISESESGTGTTGYTALHNELTRMVRADNSVRGILLDLDTPGGEAAGMHELGAVVAELGKEKPIWAIANATAASAGYWLMSSASRLYAAPGSRVGSIGVYVAHVDVSKQMEKRGVVTTFVFAGAKKVQGNPFEALPDTVRTEMQASVNSLWNEFADHVAERRGLTREAVQGFEAGVFGPQQARDLGLVDGVATLGQAMSDFAAHLNRPIYSGLSIGDAMSADRLNHSDAELASARAEARVEGAKEARTAVTAEVTKALTTEFGAALATLFPESPRASIFVEALNDGASVALATKMAAKIEDPKPVAAAPAPQHKTATQESIDRMLAANTPAVGPDDSSGDKPALDPKAARVAELTAMAKSHNRARGYIA